MKYFILVIFSYVSLFSFSSNIKLTIGNNVTNYKANLIAGVDSLATDGWDKLLEESFPTMFPMMTFAAYLETTDSSETESNGSKYYDLLWLDKDLKAVPIEETKFYRRYKVVFNWATATKITVNWNSKLQDGIDSAFVLDALEGLVFKHKMDEVSNFEITNSGIRQFFLDIYFNKDKVTSVEDENNSANISIYPNPANGILNLNTTEEINSLAIYDLMGNMIEENLIENNNNQLDISFLHCGDYYISVNYANGKKGTVKFTVIK